MTDWVVYIVQCMDKSFYTGITTDIQRRIIEHNSDGKGARYTRSRQPVKLVFQQTFESRSLACKQEYVIKQLSRDQKIKLIADSQADLLATRK